MRRVSWREVPVLLLSLGALAGIGFNAALLTEPLFVSLGRVVLLIGFGACVAAVIAAGGVPALSRPAWVTVACLVVADVLVLASAATRGCFCDGAASGFVEFSGLVIITAVAVALAPTRAWLLAGCLVGGALIVAAAAFVGASGLDANGATGVIAPGGGRLSGTLGNPNLLGFYVAIVVPMAFVGLWQGGRRRWAGVAAAILLVTALALSYSRGSLLAAIAGVGVALVVLLPRTRRARIGLATGAALLVAVCALGYTSYSAKRSEVNLRNLDALAAAADRGAPDARAQGPIPQGPSALANPSPDALEIRTDARGEGVSLPLPPLPRGLYRATFVARSLGDPIPFSYALADNLVARESASRDGVLRREDGTYSLRWETGGPVRNPRLYVWTRSGAAVFRLSGVRVALSPSTPAESAARDLRLLSRRSRVALADIERQYVQSRIDVAKEALRLFGTQPLNGIGWQRFPEVSLRTLGPEAAHATHNEPLRFAAELGLPGLLTLLGFLGSLLLVAWRLPGRFERAALLGSAVAGVVDLGFVNALAAPAVSLPFAVVAGLTIGLRVPVAAVPSGGLASADREHPVAVGPAHPVSGTTEAPDRHGTHVER